MRYHSAPSSVLASLLPSEDALRNSITPHVEDSELARICMPSTLSNAPIAAENAHGCIRAYNRHVPPSFSSTIPQASVNTSASFPNRCADSNESPTSGHLCSIFKRTQIDPCANLQSSLLDAENSKTSEIPPNLTMPAGLSSLSQPFVSTKSNLIRHSSFPAEILSQLGVQDSNEGPMQRFTGPSIPRKVSTAAESIHYDKVRFTQAEADILNDNMRAAHIVRDNSRDAHASHLMSGNTRFALKSTGFLDSNRPHLAKGSSFNGKSTTFQPNANTKVSGGETRSMGSSLCVNQSSLFRHSSLPVGILSQLSVDGTYERVSVPTSSGNSSEEGGVHYTSRVSGFWEEAGPGTVSPGQRKRGREVEDKATDRQRCSIEEELLQWNFGPQTETSSGSLLSLDDSVLCRARAKRGCATHPRSIAERVRRTKISEGMHKLQELVPNLEKQTNTATMLDEAVEYVKFLQQQVQKLTESQAKCKRMCQSNSNP
ncbi:hypothetical protein GOP47_0022434 [Adiantum capillus-veneris]|uniref:BHLH domain-containing protein n=1 Tax=Adiantum capillus-veneris TaxID=13818 RepID=A0A9D4U5U1_ADICA|nr:hypothetical protein GOP47_0022434 [Adiantum capillus-veneris]